MSVSRSVFEGDINSDCIFTLFFEGPEAQGQPAHLGTSRGHLGTPWGHLRDTVAHQLAGKPMELLAGGPAKQS